MRIGRAGIGQRPHAVDSLCQLFDDLRRKLASQRHPRDLFSSHVLHEQTLGGRARSQGGTVLAPAKHRVEAGYGEAALRNRATVTAGTVCLQDRGNLKAEHGRVVLGH